MNLDIGRQLGKTVFENAAALVEIHREGMEAVTEDVLDSQGANFTAEESAVILGMYSHLLAVAWLLPGSPERFLENANDLLESLFSREFSQMCRLFRFYMENEEA